MMIDAEDFQRVMADAIGDDNRGVGNDKLTRMWDAPWVARIPDYSREYLQSRR